MSPSRRSVMVSSSWIFSNALLIVSAMAWHRAGSCANSCQDLFFRFPTPRQLNLANSRKHRIKAAKVHQLHVEAVGIAETLSLREARDIGEAHLIWCSAPQFRYYLCLGNTAEAE